MSKKKTPREKKKAAYERDHYTFPWASPHGFRKTWKKKKNYANRVVRRKSKDLLHEVEKFSPEQLGPEKECLTSGLFRTGLSRKRLNKVGVVSLREKIKDKKERRESSFNLKARSEAGRGAGFRKFIGALLSDKEYTEDNVTRLSRAAQSSHFQTFLGEEPIWLPKLEQWLLSARKRAEWRELERERRKSR